jgi:hypothetical protein
MMIRQRVVTASVSEPVSFNDGNRNTTFNIFLDLGTFSFLLKLLKSRDSSVGIATGYGLDDRVVGVRVPVAS